MNKISTDTHYYDTQLQNVFTTKKKINNDEKITFIKTIGEIIKKTKEFKELLNPLIFNTVKKTIKLILIDVKNNYDEVNKIRVELLLPKVWNNIKNKDIYILLVFFEQMADIFISGPCAQGRTTRLIQFLNI